MKPRILDFDGSVLPLPNEARRSLAHWQETIRFGCTCPQYAALESAIGDFTAPMRDPIFMGSGDYHHISYLLIKRFETLGQPVEVVLFDNHPDNMRYPFGIHCGSWVWHVSRLPFVARVHVLGITSGDVELPHAWENHWRNLASGKVRYWCVGKRLGWMRRCGMGQSASFPSVADMLEAFATCIDATRTPLYLTIDKDVLHPEDVHTNWDQGVMRLQQLEATIRRLRPRIIGSDVTGEVSYYRYQSRFKRFLSGLDAQPDFESHQLGLWQAQHREVNLRILAALQP